MNLSAHFSLEELTWSDTGQRLGIDNTASEDILVNLRYLAGRLEDIREVMRGVRMHINSGYRCARLNTAIGGAPFSRHLLGLAADFVAPQYGTPLRICRELAPIVWQLEIDQLIYEHSWVHVSFAGAGEKPRGEILTLLPPRGYAQGILEQGRAA